MSFKFTVEVCVMTIKNDTKIEEELTCCFKIDMNFTNFDKTDMRNLTNFASNTRKCKKIAL